MEQRNQQLNEVTKEKPIELSIIDYMKQNHPEYSSPNSVVTHDFIKLIDVPMEKVCFPDDSVEPGKEITDEEARAILHRLSPEVTSSPLTYETIHIILDVYNTIMREKHIRETAETQCARAWEFNNRAHARAALGRSLEALRDYNRACEIEPDVPDYLFHRSQFLLGLGAKGDALSDATHAHQIMQKKSVDYLHDFLHLTSIYVECGEISLALKALEDFIRVFRSIIPHLAKDNHNGRRPDVNAKSIHRSCAIDCEGITSLIEKIESSLDDNNTGLKVTMKNIKRELMLVKAVIDTLQ
jgi:tetratricopeptide (TPR) repeat protein